MNFILPLMPVVMILVFLGGWLLFRRAGENKAKAEALHGFLDLPSGVWQSCLTDQQGPQFLYVPEKRQGKHTTPSKLSVAVKAGVLCDLGALTKLSQPIPADHDAADGQESLMDVITLLVTNPQSPLLE
jgi:hypothetical protein